MVNASLLASPLADALLLAWRVNFDLAVASFEPNIRSVRNFVDFSLNGHGASPARLLFVSSIGVFQSKFMYYEFSKID